MSSQLKKIKLWDSVGPGPNPPKVQMILEELNLPYEVISIPFTDVKKPEYLAVNPNGRVPAIQDPNFDITIWESGAIIEYLIERYDSDGKLSFVPGSRESFLAKQWLFFQVSGQGPYYGQLGWFKFKHPEKLPSAIERYSKEMKRVTAVLETYLKSEKEKHEGNAPGDGPWLVGNKLSYADISFFPWQRVAGMGATKEEFDADEFPHVKDWLDRMASRKCIKAVLDVWIGKYKFPASKESKE